MSNSVTVTSSQREVALRLTCALIGTGDLITTDDPQEAAEEAVRLLRHVQQALHTAKQNPSPPG